MSSSAVSPAALPSPPSHRHRFNWQYELDDGEFQMGRRPIYFVVTLFAFVLVLVLILVYARWACRYSPMSSRAAHALHAPPQTAVEAPGLPPEVIGNLPIILYGGGVNGDGGGGGGSGECCICLSAFRDGEKVKLLPECRHRFHPECVDKWLKAHPSCPLCRVCLRLDSPV